MDMQFGQYIPDTTFIHKLDPRTKVISLIFLMAGLFIKATLTSFALMTLILFVAIILGNVKLKRVAKSIKPLTFMFLFLLVLNIFIIKEGPVMFVVPKINTKIHTKAITQTVFIFWRVVLIVTMSIILTSTTNPLSLTLGLEKLNKPLKKFGVPVEVFAMMTSIALRFIPTIFEEIQKISNAQASRGLDFTNGGIKTKIKALIALVIPLFVSSFNKADELALSMESKNYNPEVSRPRYRTLNLEKRDFAILILMTIYLLSMIIWRIKTGS